MRWEGQRRSDNVEDRRGVRVPGGMAGGGIGTILVVMLISWVTGVNPLLLFQMADGLGGGSQAPTQTGPTGAPANDPQAEFAAVVLADTEDTWTRVFQQGGERYQPPTLVLFTDAVESACGTNSAAVGPFYCPLDRKVYIDLSFYRELDQQFGAPGDFAQAYVLAHEVGHHVQTLLGISERVSQVRQRSGEVESNQLSVLQELQADCFAGVWGHHAGRRNLLDPGDVEEGMQAAASIGDDTIQRRGRGRVSPESWTHGSSAQRVEWLRRGLTQGTVDACDTFGQGTRR
jgi:predicted metalloprotease